MYMHFSTVKDTLRSSGANATDTHTEEVSLYGLLLLDAARKAVWSMPIVY